MLRVLVDVQDIIDTYSEEERFSCKKYAEYKKLIQENPSFGYKRCAKRLELPLGRVRWWHTKGPKRAVPRALGAAEKLKGAGLIPFTEKHKHAPIIFNILGTLFGDGGIDRRLNTTAFISGDKRDVDLWKKDLVNTFPFAKKKMNMVEGGEYGHSYNMRTFDRAVTRFFVALGAPAGDKVTQLYEMPFWLKESKDESLKCFLDGLISSEVSVPKFVKTMYHTDYFKNFSLSLSKALDLEASHLKFMKSLKKQLNRLHVKCTPAIKKDVYRKEKRKDGHESNGYRIFFKASKDNVYWFHQTFPFIYCHGKKERFDVEDDLLPPLKGWVSHKWEDVPRSVNGTESYPYLKVWDSVGLLKKPFSQKAG